MSEPTIIYVTTGSAEEADQIASSLVESRLVACANIIPGMRSVYQWQGKIERDEEVVLILKTQSMLASRVIDAVKAQHRSECPCILSIPVSGGNPAFISWIVNETADATSD